MEIFIAVIIIVLFVLISFLKKEEEDLYKKFTEFGLFNDSTFNDFITAIRKPNTIVHKDDFIIAVWSTNYDSGIGKQNYEIVLIFDNEYNFIKKHQEIFF
jgi:hypothetical protein